MDKAKPISIPKRLVLQAYRLVRANRGASGVDGQTLQAFEEKKENNLYKVWNRLSSGSYFPQAVKAVKIPKRQGGERVLGVPTVLDRIAQTVIKLIWEPRIECIFLKDSYGYRANKSALDAVGITRERCWKYDWVLEFDICKLFDEIPHDLLWKAIEQHTPEKWIRMYLKRWLTAPLQQADGTHYERKSGTPQGGVLSPILANLFMHYAFDKWMQLHYPQLPWCRYADDGLIHCKSQVEAQQVLREVRQRLQECGLRLHPDKTRIVYCKDGRRTGNYSVTQFDFLGYTFRRRSVRNVRKQKNFVGFTPAVSKESKKAMNKYLRVKQLHRHVQADIKEIARSYNPVLRGWLEYYGRYGRSELTTISTNFNKKLIQWLMRKYKRFRGHKTRAGRYLEKMYGNNKQLFVHWALGLRGGFV